MSHSNHSWTNAPDWLEELAIAVGTLVSEPKVMDRFRYMLRDWLAEHRKRGPRSPVGPRGHLQHNPVEFLPNRPLALPEQYARLAAICDEVCQKAKRIDPWGVNKPISRNGFAKSKAGIPYAVLCSEARTLTDKDRSRIEGALESVQKDLAERLSASSGAVGHPARRLLTGQAGRKVDASVARFGFRAIRDERMQQAPPCLDDEGLKVLKCLYKAMKTLAIVEIVAQTGLSNKTVGKRLKELIEWGWAGRRGKNGGAYLTDKGKAEAKRQIEAQAP